MLKVVEIFDSLQGEGPHMGKPASFIRLAGCLAPFCPWCDTPEGLGEGTAMLPEKILEKLPQTDSLVVITGGEPFLQWGNGLEELESLLLSRGIEVHYETSGKVNIPKSSKGFIVCSPKYLDEQWHFKMTNLPSADIFKFVIGSNFAIVQDFIIKNSIDKKKVWMMAMGETATQQLEKAPEIWDFCVANGYNYSPRLHILTFNNRLGV